MSVDAICDAAGISKGAFYFHFASKAELLHAVAVPDTARLVERTREALDDGTPPDLILVGQIVTWVADDIRQVPASLVERAVLDLLAGAPIDPNTDRARRFLLREAFGLVFRAAQQGGSLPPTFPPGELAAVATWSTLQGILFWSRGVYGRRGLTTILWQRAQMIWHGGSLESLDPDCPRTRPTGSANG